MISTRKRVHKTEPPTSKELDNSQIPLEAKKKKPRERA
jgi:hypothetical protein